MAHNASVATANGQLRFRRISWTTVTTSPTRPMTAAIPSANITAVTAPSALQLAGGQESRNASEKSPKNDATAPRSTVTMSAVTETAMSPPDTGRFGGPTGG